MIGINIFFIMKGMVNMNEDMNNLSSTEVYSMIEDEHVHATANDIYNMTTCYCSNVLDKILRDIEDDVIVADNIKPFRTDDPNFILCKPIFYIQPGTARVIYVKYLTGDGMLDASDDFEYPDDYPFDVLRKEVAFDRHGNVIYRAIYHGGYRVDREFMEYYDSGMLKTYAVSVNNIDRRFWFNEDGNKVRFALNAGYVKMCSNMKDGKFVNPFVYIDTDTRSTPNLINFLPTPKFKNNTKGK
jgi:hypothetical protein